MNEINLETVANTVYLPLFKMLCAGKNTPDHEDIAAEAAYQTCKAIVRIAMPPPYLDGKGRVTAEVRKIASTIRKRRHADYLRKRPVDMSVSLDECNDDEAIDKLMASASENTMDFRDLLDDDQPTTDSLVKLLAAYGVDWTAFDTTMLRVLEVRFSAEGSITDTETAKRLGISRKAVRKARERIKARDDIQALRGKLCRK